MRASVKRSPGFCLCHMYHCPIPRQDTGPRSGSVWRHGQRSGHSEVGQLGPLLSHHECVGWNQIQSTQVQSQFLQVGANGRQWSIGIGEIGKRNCLNGPWEVGKEEGVEREEVAASKK